MFNLNYRENKPFYEQIQERIRSMITSGAMAPGEKLPSVRELAVQLAINPNTIQRAYRELERDGYIYSVSGKGSFVGGEIETIEKHKQELLTQFDSLVKVMQEAGISREILAERLSKGEGKE